MKKKFFLLLFILFSSRIAISQTNPSWLSEVTHFIENGGVYVESRDGKPLLNYHGNNSFMPASTLKLVTGLTALEILGKNYRFKTEFYLDSANNLYVKGYGDPYLISEELSKIVKLLQGKGLKLVNDIILDATYFEEIKVPGVSASLNPYDALNSALSANFNTIFIQKNKSGDIVSAEPQTPMTELTRTLAARAPYGKSRINLADHPNESLLYVGYLLKAFMEQENISTSGKILKGNLNPNAKLFYQHYSSKNLDEVTQAMMKFSTNFIANQLFLILGAEKIGAPANLAKGKQIVTAFLKDRLHLRDFNVEEGSGISRENRMTPAELVKVVKAFEKYRSLLPEKLDRIQAKTGTLNGVASLAGYFDSAQYQTIYFAIILNQKGNHRESIAKTLYQHLH